MADTLANLPGVSHSVSASYWSSAYATSWPSFWTCFRKTWYRSCKTNSHIRTIKLSQKVKSTASAVLMLVLPRYCILVARHLDFWIEYTRYPDNRFVWRPQQAMGQMTWLSKVPWLCSEITSINFLIDSNVAQTVHEITTFALLHCLHRKLDKFSTIKLSRLIDNSKRASNSDLILLSQSCVQ